MTLTMANMYTSAVGVAAFYQEALARPSASTVHLPRLRALADGLELAVEFGVKKGASSAALLMGAQRVIGYDLVETRDGRRLQGLAGARWSYRIEDSRLATFDACDLLFIDSLHTFDQVQAELTAHAHKVRRYLVFHDVLTFGSIGAAGESGQFAWTYQVGQSVPQEALGIRPAIDALMIRDRTWTIAASYVDSHGLLVLERAR